MKAPAESGALPGAAPDVEASSLVIEGLVRRFGGFAALGGVDLDVPGGTILGLVGPNGSGKTTLINVVSGVYAPTAGSVRLGGRDVSGLPSHRLVRLGLNRTFQIPKPFAALSVGENLAVAVGHSRRGRPRHPDVLAEVGLDGLADRPAGTLNASQQKRLDLARALVTNPSVLLVDELGAGLGSDELDELARYLRHLAANGITLLVVEHLLGFLEQLTSTVAVLSAGRRLFVGSLQEAAADPEVVRVFLGG